MNLNQDLNYRFAFDSWVYAGEPVEQTATRLRELGYSALELAGEPSAYNINEINQAMEATGMAVSSVGSLPVGPERDLAHPDPKMRQSAIEYHCRCAEFTAAVDGSLMIFGPTGLMKTKPLAPLDDEWKWGLESARAVGEHAAGVGIDLVLEPWNRYETYMINRVSQAIRFWKETGLENGGVMGDTFHMNIEEASIAGALRLAGPLLRHVHVSESNRADLGSGHMDLDAIAEVLIEIGYAGYLAIELLPAGADFGDSVPVGPPSGPFLDAYPRQCIDHFNEVDQRVRATRS